jgi:TonB family protein
LPQTLPLDAPDSPPPSIPRVRQASAEVSEGLDPAIIRRVARAHINEIRYCYNEGLSRNPELEGRAVVRFEIGTSGRVHRAELQTSTLADAAVESCMVEAVERWMFPKPNAGRPVVVSYPFVLSPG